MNLTHWSPFREMEDLLNRYTQRGLTTRDGAERQLLSDFDWSPAVDIVESDKEFLIKVELPEVDKKDVSVAVNNGVLNIEGERNLEKETDEGSKFHRVERFHGRFSRSFSLPDNVNQEDIKAKFKDGVLKLHLEKTAESKPRSIDVNIQD